MRKLTRWCPLLAALTLLNLALFVTGCGGTPAPAPGAANTATATPHTPHAGQDAAHILAGLKAAGLPIGDSVTYTAATDPNALLARPGQYTSKVNFTDTRIPASGNTSVNIDVQDGGSIEVFASVPDAMRRYSYVATVTASTSLFVEYDYLDGLVLLRLSHQLTPAQAQAYLTALQALP